MPLYAFGSNGSGQLGVGHTEDSSQPQLVPYSDSWRVEQLAAGGNHTVILCSDGSVRATGNNEDSRSCVCGRSTNTFLTMPLWEHGDGTLTVEQVACTWSASFLLCTDGTVYTCGSGSSGELGLGLEKTNARLLRRIAGFPPPATRVVRLAACMGHVIAVLSNGEVHGWGKGRKGQLGEPCVDVWSPRKIDGIGFHAQDAICGKDFSLILGDKSSATFAILGPNRGDRFGIRSTAPTFSFGRKQTTASWGSIYGLDDAGRISAWGRDDHGQLPPSSLPDVEGIAAGSEHVLALGKSGKVLAWGWGEHGNCGSPTDKRGDVKGHWLHVEVPGRVSKVFAGCATSFIETVD